MEICPDFKELLVLLNKHEVEYLIVGGYAVAFHGAPRFTGDMDIYVRPSVSNADRVWNALDEFGFGEVGLSTEDFARPGMVVQLGVPPVRIDFVTSLSGVSWEEALLGRTAGKYGDTAAYFIGREQLIANKRAAGRAKDVADIEALAEKQGRRS